MLQIHGLNIAREEIERADALRYRWGKLQNRCVSENYLDNIFHQTLSIFSG